MEQFKKREFKLDKENFDDGILVADLLDLISSNVLYDTVIEELGLNEIQNEFIAIKGCSSLVSHVRKVNSKYIKTDLVCELNDISFYHEGRFTFNFHNCENISTHDYFDSDFIPAIPIYSSTRDFFSGILNMDKYASRLIERDYSDILVMNYSYLKNKLKNKRKYRLLYDLNDEKYFLRGIISTGSYYPYDNNMAVVFGILALHKEMKSTGVEYAFKMCEYNESTIRIFFESTEARNLKGVGFVRSLVEISNDEIKREALKFMGACSIIFDNSDNEERELFIKPKEVKSKILSIRHNVTPKTAIPELINIQKTQTVHQELFDDISKISAMKNPEEFKFLLRQKVENARSEDIKMLKNELMSVLDKKIGNIVQLLELFDKMNLVAERDIEVKEYLRFLIYQVLTGAKD